MLKKSNGSAVSYKGITVQRFVSNEKNKFGADVVSINRNSDFGHVHAIQRVLNAFIENSYEYSEEHAELLTSFILFYNASNRGKYDKLKPKYSSNLTKNLDKNKVGISTDYTEWAGNTQIVIPIRGNILKKSNKDVVTNELERETIKSVKEKVTGKEDLKKFDEFQKDKIDTEKKEVAKLKEDLKKDEAKVAKKTDEVAKDITELKKDPEENKEELAKKEAEKKALEAKKAEITAKKDELALKEAELKKDEKERTTGKKLPDPEVKTVAKDVAKTTGEPVKTAKETAQDPTADKKASDGTTMAKDPAKTTDSAKSADAAKSTTAAKATDSTAANNTAKSANTAANTNTAPAKTAESAKSTETPAKSADAAKATDSAAKTTAKDATTAAPAKQADTTAAANNTAQPAKTADSAKSTDAAKTAETPAKTADAAKTTTDNSAKTAAKEASKSTETVAALAKETAKSAEETKSTAKDAAKTTDESKAAAKDAAKDAAKKVEEKLPSKEEVKAMQGELEKLKKEKQEKDENTANVIGDKIVFLKVKDLLAEGHYNSELWSIDTENDEELFQSPFTKVCGKEFKEADNGILVMSFKKDDITETDTHHLALVDKDKLQLIKQSKETVHWRSFIEAKEGKVYAIMKEGNNFYLARFTADLELELKSEQPVSPDSQLAIKKSKIYLTGKPDGKTVVIKVFNKADLKIKEKKPKK